MTKREFLDELRQLTGALSDGERARLLEYYTEMIDDRMEEGVGEEEAVGALGDPAALASALVPVPREGGADSARTVAALESLRIRVTGADVIVRHEALENGAAAQLRFSDPHRFTWRMDGDALEVVQPDADAPKFSLRWIQQMVAAPAQRLTVILSRELSGALDFEGDGGDLKIEGASFAKARLVSASGDIELRDVECAGGIGIDIRTHSGDIKLHGVRADNLMINAASGDISGKHLSMANRLRLETASGDMELRDVECAGMHIDTASGDIEIGRGKTGETAIRAASGDVDLRGLECDPTLSVETASGDISLARCIACETRLKAVSGDVDLLLEPLPCGYDVSAGTVHGDIDLDERLSAKSALEQPRIAVQTVNGDVRARMAE